MTKKIIITVDVEKDISKYIKDSYIGIEEGILPLLDLLKKFKIIGDFFVTANICNKYPQVIKQIVENGHNIGCHGYDHSNSYEFYCTKNFKKQYDSISKATKVIEKVVGDPPVMFRAPNFSVNGDTIKVLEKLEYTIDSSVLPGRIHKKWRLFTIYDFRNAPRKIYHPSTNDVGTVGKSPINEIPITENPFIREVPIGMGYLNSLGLDETIKIIEQVKEEYVIFLIHPWELVDLSQHYPNLREWLHKSCSSDLSVIASFLKYLQKHYLYTTLNELINDFQDGKD